MKTYSSRSRSRGVTLMELVIVVGIVGILGAIAIPSYRNYIIRVNRTDAKRDLMAYAQQLERCFTRGNDYTAGDCTVDFDPGITNDEGTYTTTAAMTATTFTLTATPVGGQANDARCGNFTLTHTGVQGVSGTMSSGDCWRGRGG